jgi:outer membrane protein assembly factor BamA
MEFDGDNGHGRWIAGSDWDTCADANRDPDSYRYGYGCRLGYSSTNGYSHRHGYRCTNSYSDAHNSIHADPNSYFYASINDDTNANAWSWSGGCLQF